MQQPPTRVSFPLQSQPHRACLRRCHANSPRKWRAIHWPTRSRAATPSWQPRPTSSRCPATTYCVCRFMPIRRRYGDHQAPSLFTLFFSHLQTQDRQTEKKKILLGGSGPTMQPSTEWLSISCFPARVANNSTRCRRPVEAFPHSLARRTWRTKTSPTVQPQSLLLVCIRRSSDFLPSDTFPPLRFPISTSKNLANPYNNT